MGYRLQMSAEIHDWLTELRGSDPSTAVLAGLALAALADAGDRLGPPLVIAVPGRLAPEELPSALDRRYQAWLESTTATRRRVAEAATLRKDIERQLTRPEPAQAPAALQERFAGGGRGGGAADRGESAGADAGRRLPVQEGGPQGGLSRRPGPALASAGLRTTAMRMPSSWTIPAGAQRPRLMRSPARSSRSWAPRTPAEEPDGAPARCDGCGSDIRILFAVETARHRAAHRRPRRTRRRAGPLPRSHPPRLRRHCGRRQPGRGSTPTPTVRTRVRPTAHS